MSVTAAAKKPGGMLDEVQRVLGQFETLQADVQALRQQREDLRRFLDIDAETAELGRLQTEKATVLSNARAESVDILAAARIQADGIIEEARQQADAIMTTASAVATKRAEEILTEARQSATTLRTEAGRGLEAARRESRQTEAVAETRLVAAKLAESVAAEMVERSQNDLRALDRQRQELEQRVTEVRRLLTPLRTAVLSFE